MTLLADKDWLPAFLATLDIAKIEADARNITTGGVRLCIEPHNPDNPNDIAVADAYAHFFANARAYVIALCTVLREACSHPRVRYVGGHDICTCSICGKALE